MKKLLSVLVLSLMLTACASTPHYDKAENLDLTQFNDCAAIETALNKAQSNFKALKAQKNSNNAGNAVTVAGALLALNPFMLLDINRTDKITEHMESYQKQIAELQAKQKQLCEQENTVK